MPRSKHLKLLSDSQNNFKDMFEILTENLFWCRVCLTRSKDSMQILSVKLSLLEKDFLNEEKTIHEALQKVTGAKVCSVLQFFPHH